MHRLTHERVRRLAARVHDDCVSIYLPTHRAGPEVRQDPIRLKNLLSRAERSLEIREVTAEKTRALLAQFERLIDDREFWRNQGDGLALFASTEEHWVFRLPMPVSRLVVVSQRFHLKPMIPLLTNDSSFNILALSQNRVRLYEATRFTMRELDSDDIPDNLADAVGYDWEQRSLQFHSSTPFGNGRRTAEFHGQGAGHDDSDAELTVFLRMVDRGVRGLIRDRRAPMVVAAVDELYGKFRKQSRHPWLAAEYVRGNPDSVEAQQLQESAWRVVEPLFSERREAVADRVRSLLGTGRSVQHLEEVVIAAAEGRVEELFVAAGMHLWGRYERNRRRVTVHERPQVSDEDLLNRAAIEAITHDGVVFVVPPDRVPSDGSPVVAALRY